MLRIQYSIWRFPASNFEPEDEGWCRQLGVGHEVTTTIPCAIVKDGKIYAYPVDENGQPIRDRQPRIIGELRRA